MVRCPREAACLTAHPPRARPPLRCLSVYPAFAAPPFLSASSAQLGHTMGRRKWTLHGPLVVHWTGTQGALRIGPALFKVLLRGSCGVRCSHWWSERRHPHPNTHSADGIHPAPEKAWVQLMFDPRGERLLPACLACSGKATVFPTFRVR